MSRFRTRFFSALLVTFWLLATQHCGLAAAGLLDSHADETESCCVGSEPHCSHDGCEVVEGDGYSAASASKTLSAPLAVVCGWACPAVSEPPSTTVPAYQAGGFDPPLNWVTTWQFVQRAARSPRAPSLV